MKKWLHNIEVLTDKSIPFLLLILLFVIIGEFAFHEFMLKYKTIVQILDWAIIFVFVADLIFKYNRMRNLPKFLMASWLEILAVFPFFLVFRFFEGLLGLFGIGETVTRTQQIVHVIEGSEKEITTIIKEGGRTEGLIRFLRPISRSIRFFKLSNPKTRRETRKDLILAGRGAEYFLEEIEEVPSHVKAAVFYEKPGVSHGQVKIKRKK